MRCDHYGDPVAYVDQVNQRLYREAAPDCWFRVIDERAGGVVAYFGTEADALAWAARLNETDALAQIAAIAKPGLGALDALDALEEVRLIAISAGGVQ